MILIIENERDEEYLKHISPTIMYRCDIVYKERAHGGGVMLKNRYDDVTGESIICSTKRVIKRLTRVRKIKEFLKSEATKKES
jgi:hypothetical protein